MKHTSWMIFELKFCYLGRGLETIRYFEVVKRHWIIQTVQENTSFGIDRTTFAICVRKWTDNPAGNRKRWRGIVHIMIILFISLYYQIYYSKIFIGSGNIKETIILAEAWGLQCYGEYRWVWDSSWILVSYNARNNERTCAVLR